MSTRSIWQRPLPPARCDVAVVGGGVIGAATAFALAREEPDARIVLVEAGEVAHGASGRNAGFLIPGPPSDFATAVDRYGEETAGRVLDLTLENIRAISELDGSLFDLRLSGCLIAAGSPEEAGRLQRSAELLQARGAACDLLAPAEVSRRTGSKGFHGGLALGAGGTLDPVRLVRHLLTENGATVVEHWPVETVEYGGGAVRVKGAGGGLEASTVILSLNAFLPGVVEAAAAWVRPVRAQMLATAPVERFLEVPVYSHEGFFYVRQTDEGRVLAGGARHLFEAEEVGYETVTTATLQQALEDYLREHFPASAGARIERRWSGTMGFSPDGLPVAGALPGVPNVYFACGFTGHGMAYGLRFGEMMARVALGIHDPAADLFAPRAF